MKRVLTCCLNVSRLITEILLLPNVPELMVCMMVPEEGREQYRIFNVLLVSASLLHYFFIFILNDKDP